jgi:hypothetical protein
MLGTDLKTAFLKMPIRRHGFCQATSKLACPVPSPMLIVLRFLLTMITGSCAQYAGVSVRTFLEDWVCRLGTAAPYRDLPGRTAEGDCPYTHTYLSVLSVAPVNSDSHWKLATVMGFGPLVFSRGVLMQTSHSP